MSCISLKWKGILVYYSWHFVILFYIQQVYQAKEVTESNPQIKQALCATIIDTDRVCLGTEDGLFCIELMKESKYLFQAFVTRPDPDLSLFFLSYPDLLSLSGSFLLSERLEQLFPS